MIPRLLFLVTLGGLGLPSMAQSVTFHGDIAPLIHRHCTSCHRPQQSGPFSLITYRDVQKRAGTIEEAIESRFMPPWKPVNDSVAFAHDRRLTKEQIALFRKWREAGMPEGDPGRAADPPRFPSDWYLGKPDMLVRMNGRFSVPAEGPDIYRSFVFPLNLPEGKWVKALELRPLAKGSLHHALFFLDRERNARDLDGSDGRPGLNGMAFLGLGEGEGNFATASASFSSGISLGGHVPGATPTVLPQGLALEVPAGSDIVMQTHFHPVGREETEQAELALYFAERAPERELIQVQVPPLFGATMGIDIPADASAYVLEDRIALPVDVDAVLIGGHAHYLCRTMRMIAQFPDGSERVLLEIDDWDLAWQDRYQFREPISLPAGTVLQSRLTYDNSKENPRNPFSPPQRVRWGRESTDEMGSLTLGVAPRNPEDGAALREAIGEHVKGTVVALLGRALDDGRIEPGELPESSWKRMERRLDANKNGLVEGLELLPLRVWLAAESAKKAKGQGAEEDR